MRHTSVMVQPGGVGGEVASELEERARVTADKIVLGLAYDPDYVIALGVELLVAGHEGARIVDLAALPPRSMWSDVEPVARRALEEIGVWPPDRDDACWELARYWAKGLLAGGSQTYERAAALWGLWSTLGSPPEIGVLVELMDEWEAASGRTRRDRVRDVSHGRADHLGGGPSARHAALNHPRTPAQGRGRTQP